ncbi:LuxR C-terminal-related transcriptional regulator [Spirochaeta africana]|uniref:ATP-dependent transcriptional regulator n=1 Tax=Spirochaeta africana (strain ATCC 700263 / DSM 8902 / Z-7692) TaxID=889378 RepID=H9UHP9_SPIAZ|nr:LuxR C-terminal-related transcriptional regulator [Spirochaeta africana]AFG37042.1 ATP-dependent transcriptional regulator [Spirochaeta africana DSM 8902]
MKPTPLLRIKTCLPPLPSGTIMRERLREFLAAPEVHGFTRQLTLVAAPAGFGKTTQVRALLAGHESHTAWLSIDQQDNDPRRFWLHLLAALNTVQTGFGDGISAALSSQDTDSTAGLGTLLSPLLNELFELESPTYLVLDDLHLIDASVIHHELQHMIEHLAPMLHVIITTRSDPPWPLHRWRAKNMMQDIRLEDLSFTLEETTDLCRERTPVDLNQHQLTMLHERTDGWAAGLQLALLTLNRSHSPEDFFQEFTGSNRHILHYLTDEIFARQTPEIQDFLLTTSILPRFTAELCNAVASRSDSSRCIENLERHNLFIIRMDENGTWYRYHALFAELLQYRLQQTSPERIPLLHHQAAQWYLDRNLPAAAIVHAQDSGDPEKTAAILDEFFDEILAADGPGQINRCLAALPDNILERYPVTLLHKALYCLNYLGMDTAFSYIEKARKAAEAADSPERLQTMTAVVMSFYHVYTNEHDQARRYAELALQRLSPTDTTWRTRVALYAGDARYFSGDPKQAIPCYLEADTACRQRNEQFLLLSTGMKVATTLYALGDLAGAERQTRELLQSARQHGFSRVPRVGLLWGLLGELQRERDNLAEAQRCIERGLLIGRPELPNYAWNSLYLAACLFSREQNDEALAVIHRIEELDRQARLPAFITIRAACWKARILHKQGNTSRARHLLADCNIRADAPVPEGLEFGGAVLTRILLAEDDPAGRQLLESLKERALHTGHLRHALELQLIEASNHQRPTDAGSYHTAYAQGFHRGFRRLFIEHGCLECTAGATDQKISAGLVEELSSREIEVLQLVDQGLSNDEIGESLYISTGTVKWHLSNIYGKLGVSKRTRAAAEARRLGVL